MAVSECSGQRMSAFLNAWGSAGSPHSQCAWIQVKSFAQGAYTKRGASGLSCARSLSPIDLILSFTH